MVGYGGHALVVADIILGNGETIKGYVDKAENNANLLKIAYLGSEEKLDVNHLGAGAAFALAVGNNRVREQLGSFIEKNKGALPTLVSSNSIVSRTADLGRGVLVGNGAIVNAFVKAADYAIMNTGCIIEHECTIGAAAHIAPGAVLAGNVTVGCRSFIGANAVIKEGVTIGNDVIVGAGAVVIRDISDNTKMAGNPAIKI